MAKRRKPKRTRPTKAIVARRVEELVRILLDGAEPGWDICEFVREKEQEKGSVWQLAPGAKPLSASQIRRYVARAYKLIGESGRAQTKKLLRRHLAQRRNLYAKAVSQGDIRAALACLDSEAKLAGLIDHEMNRLVEALQKEIAEIKAKYGDSNGKATVEGDASAATRLPPAGHADDASARAG